MVSILSRLGLNRHVSDSDLTVILADQRLAVPSRTAATEHVGQCPACRTRLSSLSAWLDNLKTEARQEADEAFPRERLAAQQTQILRRLEAMERPAKVLAVPRFTRPIATMHSGRQRWIAAAAVAGLVVGIGLGQIFDIRRLTSRPGGFAPTSGAIVSSVVPEPRPVTPVAFTSSDEDYLYDQGQHTARDHDSLRSLHELPPSAREYEPR